MTDVSSLEMLRQREERVKMREKIISQREQRLRTEFLVLKKLDYQWQYRVRRLKRYKNSLLSYQNSLQQNGNDLEKLADTLRNMRIKVNEKNDFLDKMKEDLDEKQRLLSELEYSLQITAENFIRRERTINQQEEDIAIAHEDLRQFWENYNTEILKLRKLNCLLSCEIQRIISLECQENRPMVRVPSLRKDHHAITSNTIGSSANRSDVSNKTSSVNQFRMKLIEFLNENGNVNTENLDNQLFTVVERNRVREEERILRNRVLRDRLAYIWRNTSKFMRRVFEYYPITSDECARYVNDCGQNDDESSLPSSTSSWQPSSSSSSCAVMPSSDVLSREKCYASNSYKFINCNERVQIASPFCLHAENYGLSASTTATANCIERHVNSRLCKNQLYKDNKDLPEHDVFLCANVVKPSSSSSSSESESVEVESKIFARMYLSDSTDDESDDSMSNNDIFEPDRHFRLGHRLERDRTLLRRHSRLRIPMYFTRNEVCSRDSFDVRRRMNHSYNPFAWMYSNGRGASVMEQLCGTHLNLGEDMQPIVSAVLQYQCYKNIISVDCMDKLINSSLIQLCGSAVMFSLFTTLRFDSIRIHTLEEYLIIILYRYAYEANHCVVKSSSNTENNESNATDVRINNLIMNKWCWNLPNFIGERTGAIWMMFDNAQFFGILWRNLSSQNMPHVQTHVASIYNNDGAFRYRVHSTISVVCVVMARLARIIAVGDYFLLEFFIAEFCQFMDNDRVCLAVPFSFFCTKEVVRKEIQKVLGRIEPSALDFKINMYAIAYMLRVRDIADDELSQEWLTHRSHPNFDKADLRIRDIVERDIIAVRDRAFTSHDDIGTCNTQQNNKAADYRINFNDESSSLSVRTLTALSIRSILINSGISPVRTHLNAVLTPTDDILTIVRYFTDCMWHFVSELPVSVYAKDKRCYKHNRNCPRSYYSYPSTSSLYNSHI